MADYTELELKTFELSSGNSDSSLSVTSLALVSGLSARLSSEELGQLIQSKQLWLASTGVCRIQIIVRQSQLSTISDETEVGFLEHLADAICQCSLWPALGLTIKQEDIQYRPLYDGAPNLYFIVEHPHKSSLLLSPPHSPTACFTGIECLFCYQSYNHEASSFDTERPDMRGTNMDEYYPMTTLQLEDLSSAHDVYDEAISSDYCGDPIVDTPIDQVQQQWDNATYLAQMALHVTIGVKKRMSGLRLLQLDTRPSLLELAPAIWNAHYLEAMTFHVAKFPIISSILATSSRGHSASLRQKSAKLLLDNSNSNYDQADTRMEADFNLYKSSVDQKLWGLVQTALEPTTRIKNAYATVNSQWRKTANGSFHFMSTDLDNLNKLEIGGPVNISERMCSDDIGLGDTCGGWLSYQIPGYQVPGNDTETDLEAEYQRWRYKSEDPPSEITHLAAEEFQDPVRPEYSPNLDIRGSFTTQSSSSEELYDRPTTQRDISEEFTDSEMYIDDLHSPDYFYNPETIYDITNETPSELEIVPRYEKGQNHVYVDDNDYFTQLNGESVGGNNYQNEELDSQTVEMYEHY
ncbi:hypothetical protein F4804DRAFT_334396 [Jackrogersella minutella]|nr:hypothetical protein F4804DRAFT_334396 [Jackrogersella minutella]